MLQVNFALTSLNLNSSKLVYEDAAVIGAALKVRCCLCGLNEGQPVALSLACR